MKQFYFTFFVVLFFSSIGISQVILDAELRPRFEYRHGYKTLFPDNTDPAAFISQRTRLNAFYSDETLTFYLSAQDIRVWGDVPQTNIADKNGVGIHQAWGEIKFTPEFSVKLGRQALVYDDHRILGSVDWVQQARSHDLALLKLHKNNFSGHLGIAFNQDEEALTGNTLHTNTYKAMQYVWLNKKWEDIGASFLLLNNGMQYIDALSERDNEIRYSQTFGTHLTYNKNKFGLMANLYYQTGTDVNDNDLSAYLLGIEAGYQVNSIWTLQVGAELQSGNDYGAPSDGKNKAFTPLYGTNHKFNGHMDYFYVGNHGNNVGLLDVYIGSTIKTGEKTDFGIRVHNFNAAANMVNNTSKQLGTEADISFNYKFTNAINIKAGYSHMFASKGMEQLKNNFDGNVNNWGWIMVTLKPTLFSSANN